MGPSHAAEHEHGCPLSLGHSAVQHWAAALVCTLQVGNVEADPDTPSMLLRRYHTGKPSAFLWQWIGSALFFLFPAITYTLQARLPAGTAAAAGRRRWPLLIGLLLCAARHALQSGQQCRVLELCWAAACTTSRW